ncbi:hypothetical protein ASPVEDRAFT_220645 [Aspergillus versicolor CBS 583.65]|uniref:Probable kinetochore protein NUF2 n=1 Tax=Aspergillus versicolor CBS 583.65 TaxID=1036611 RepID=A0A1L9P3P8_ASPVE|nr:uncharacterized protein ASPVEDRAFT_220645 [Aspergillus versicolor CBS 583.65]OJI96157.1 hypothetical protein ASPVEDRAFT_220645 [Aspergillus versicolor CBS 583.65]
MAYNNRMSQQFHGSQQHGRGRKKEDENDALMRLPDKEIAGCINDIGIPFTAADLIKPNPQQVQMVLEWFAELLMNTTRDTVEPAMRAAADDVCGDFPDIVPTDTRNLMGFFANVRRLMLECGVNDFTFTDLTKPTHDRLVKIFSYLINFVRFRESQTAVIDEHFNKTEKTKQRIDTLYGENQDMEQRLEDMRRSLRSNESEVKEKMRRNDELKARLRQLGISQEQVAETLERVKADKARQQTKLKEKMERAVKTRQEVDKLRPYVMESPASLQATLTELSDNLLREKAQIDAMEKRARALQTSSDTFTVVSNDVQACVKLLEDVSVELHKEDDEELRALRNKEAISERGNNVREVEQTEGLLQWPSSGWRSFGRCRKSSGKSEQRNSATWSEGGSGSSKLRKRWPT